MKLLLAFVCGLLALPVALGVAYWVWALRGKNTGWPG